MPRPNTGEVTEWLWKDGRTITFGARIHVSGSRYRLRFGTSHEGWDRTRAESEMERILQEVDAGIWIAPLRKTSAAKAPIARPDGHQRGGVQRQRSRAAAALRARTGARGADQPGRQSAGRQAEGPAL